MSPGRQVLPVLRGPVLRQDGLDVLAAETEELVVRLVQVTVGLLSAPDRGQIADGVPKRNVGRWG